MSNTRTKSWLLAAIVALAGVESAQAQRWDGSWIGVDDLQFFAPPDISEYSGGVEPKTGWFAVADQVWWWIMPPKETDIGVPGGAVIVADGGLGGRIPESFQAIGFATPTVPLNEWGRLSTNGMDTSMFNAQQSQGQRIEFGCVDCDGHWGLQFGGAFVQPWTERVTKGDVDVVFQDTYVPMTWLDQETGLLLTRNVGYLDGFANHISDVAPLVDNPSFDIILFPVITQSFGRYFDGDLDGTIDPDNPADILPIEFIDLDDLYRMPVVFDEINIRNVMKRDSLEVMPFYRLDPFHNGSVLELGLGTKYDSYDERFDVEGFGGLLGESNWNTRARNRIVGPQASARWSISKGHWTASAEGRGFFGFNFQSVHQTGGFEVFSNSEFDPEDRPIPPADSTFRAVNTLQQMSPNAFEHQFDANEFAPGAELRINTSYQFTKALAVKLGWTGMWQDGLARPSDMIIYRLPIMGIRDDKNVQDTFIHGFNLGLELNR